MSWSPHRRTASRRSPLGPAICFLVVSLGACGGATRLIPDRVDRVVSVSPTSAEGPATAVLQSGESVAIDSTKILLIAPGLQPGALLIRGSSPRPWLMGVALEPSRGCFWVDGWGTEDGSLIVLDKGPVLPKADTFDRRTMGVSEHRFERSGFCLNEQGQVTSVQL